MSESNNLTKKASKEITKRDLSYTQKCIILAKISKDKKTLINLYDNIPIVRLYTSNLEHEYFIYSKIKGAFCFLYEEKDKNFIYYLQIYDIKSLNLVFNLQVNQKMINDFIELENNFLCLPTKFHFLGFKFYTKDSMQKFLKIFSCEGDPDKKLLDINIKARGFKCTYKEILKLVKDVKSTFEKKYKSIDSLASKNEKEKEKIYNFQKLDDLYYLVNCIEYDEDNKKINVFIDRTINQNMIKTYIDLYKNTKKKNSLNLKIIFDDYTHISKKKIYVDLLINNLLNNFIEVKRAIIFKREHKKRHNKEDFEESKRINSENYIQKEQSNNKNENYRNSAIIPKPNFKNELQRKGNINASKKNQSNKLLLQSSLTVNEIDIIKEMPEEDIDHLKMFDKKEKNKKTKK